MIKKNIIIGVLLAVVLSGVVYGAFQVGDTMTQEEVDNINATTISLNCYNYKTVVDQQKGFIGFGVSCWRLNQTDADTYKIYEHKFGVYIAIDNYIECKEQGYTKAQCSNYVRSLAVDEAKRNIEHYRQEIRDYQTKDYSGMDATSTDFMIGGEIS